MIIVEFTIDHPLLRETRHRVSDVKLEWEDTSLGTDGPIRLLSWIESDDFDAVAVAVSEDPTVRNPTVLTETSSRRLYRFDYAGEGRETTITTVLADVGGLILEATGTSDGWSVRARFPERDGIQRLYRHCSENEIDITLHRIYEAAGGRSEIHPKMTESQRETLHEAADSGYLEIPRECTLAELGERLGISESAASERFRRGVKRLVEQTR